MLFENPLIQSEGNVDANRPSSAYEETVHKVKIEAPTVNPDGQTTKSETQAIGEQIGNSYSNTPSAIQSEGKVDANRPSSAHEETRHKVKIEAPTVHPDGQTSKSETQAIGEQLGNICPSTSSSAIQSEGKMDDNRPSSAHEETTHQVKIEAPTVHPDGQTSNSETQAVGGQVENNCPNTFPSCKLQKPVMCVKSPDWLPEGWITEVRIRDTGHRDKYYSSPLLPLHHFRSKKEVFNFLEKGKLNRRKSRSKMKPEGEFGVETKGLSTTISEINSSASNVDKISPSGASCAFLQSSPSCMIPSSITCGSDFLVPTNHTSPLPFSHSPMNGFTPLSGAVNKLSIPTTTPISHLHFSADSQSAINPDIIRRPTKVRWVLYGPEGSYVPIFTEEKPIDSCKKESKQMLDVNGSNSCKG